jgi:hypothetical protein
MLETALTAIRREDLQHGNQRRICLRLHVQRLQSPAEERRAVRLSDGEQLRARGRHRVFRPLDSDRHALGVELGGGY